MIDKADKPVTYPVSDIIKQLDYLQNKNSDEEENTKTV